MFSVRKLNPSNIFYFIHTVNQKKQHISTSTFRTFSTHQILPTEVQKLPIISLIPSKAEAEVIMPGFSYGDIDRTGKVKLWKIPLFSEAARVALLTTNLPQPLAPTSLGQWFQQNLKGTIIFMAAARYTIEPEFYSLDHCHNHLRYRVKLSYVGRSSYQHEVEAYSMVTGHLLHKDNIFNVVVDKEFHKPLPVSSSLPGLYEQTGLTNLNIELPRIVPPIKPAKTQHRYYHCHWSHADINFHTNQSQYIKFVHDAACDMSMAEELPHFKGDIANFKVKQIEVSYKGETRPGDRLCIHCWEMNHNQLGFQIENAAGLPVFNCKLTFY